MNIMVRNLKMNKKVVDASIKAGGLLIALLIVYVCVCGGGYSYRRFIISFACTLTCVFLLGIFIWGRLELYKYVFICIILVGGLSLLIQPILNTPDEAAHFARAEMLSRGQWHIDPDEGYHSTIKSVKDMWDEVGVTIVDADIKGEEINYAKETVNHVAAANMSIMYVPQAMGILIAKTLQLNGIWLLWLARFFNLVFYSFAVSGSIYLASKYKFLLFFIAILPMSIQQAASCSPDAFINASMLIYIALFLNLYIEGLVSSKKMIFMYLLGIVIAMVKVTNICLTGLILLLPMEKRIGSKRTLLVKAVSIMSIVVIGGVHYLYTTTFTPVVAHLTWFRDMNIDSSAQIRYIFGNFSEWLPVFGNAIINDVAERIMQLSQFGNLDYGYPALSIIIVFLFAKLCYQLDGIFIKRINRFLVLLMVLGTCCLTYLALYITWTPVGSDQILGVQGRYFIPMLMVMPLLFVPNTKKDVWGEKQSTSEYTTDMVIILFMVGAMLIVTGVRYY